MLMPSRNGAEPNQIGSDQDVKRLPVLLKELGYETVAFGNVAHDDAADYGFDEYEYESEGVIFKGGIEYAVKYLNKRKSGDKPVVLFVGTKDPHVPWPDNERFDPSKLTIPERFIDTPETRKYLAKYYIAVEKADDQLEEVYKLAQEKLDNPLFIHTADNGPQLPFAKVLMNTSLPYREKVYAANGGDNVYPIRSLQTQDYKLIWNLYPENRHDTHINLSGDSDDVHIGKHG